MMQGQERTEGGDPRPDRARAMAIVRVCRDLAEPFVADLHARVAAAVGQSLKSLEAQALEAPDQVSRELMEELVLLRKDADRLGDAFRQRFGALFSESLREADDGRPADRESRGSGQELELALVDNAQLEEWLAVDTLAARVHELCAREIGALRQRLDHLLPELGLTKYRLPIGPEKFCRAFHDALEQFGASAAHMHCYGLFETVLMDRIADFYHDANRLLASKGILPSLVTEEAPRRARERASDQRRAESWEGAFHGFGQSAHTGGAARAGHGGAGQGGPGWHVGPGSHGGGHGGSAGAGGPGGFAGPGTEGEHSALADGAPSPRAAPRMGGSAGGMEFQAMPQMLAGGAGGATAGGAAQAVVVAPALIETLSALQRDDASEARTGELIRGGLRHYVHGRFEGGGGTEGEISRLDDETIEIIGMIFNYILDDPALPDFMKALIARLQIPVLKVALIDRDFFTRKDHPARVLLNELTQAGATWRDEDEAARDRLFRAIEEIVRRVLDEFDADLGLFDTLLAELRHVVAEETRGLEEARGALLEAARRDAGEERLRKGVLGELAARMHGKPVPGDIRSFLLGPWRDYVTLVTREEGETSAAHAEGLRFVEDLLWSIIPRRTADDRRRLSALLPTLLRSLAAGMERIGRDEGETEQVVRTLERYHTRSLGLSARTGAPASGTKDAAGTGDADGEGDDIDRMLAEFSAGLDAIDDDANLAGLASFDDVIDRDLLQGSGAFERMVEEMGLADEPADTGPRIDDEYTARVRDLAVGDWVELDEGDGRVMRVRVAWKGDELSAFSFVNRQYKVVAERAFYVLAEELRTGLARLIEHQGLFDRAIDGVIAGVMRLAGAAAR